MFSELHYAVKKYLSGNVNFSEFKREKPPYAEVVENLNDKCTIVYVDYGNEVNIAVIDKTDKIQTSIDKNEPKYPNKAYLNMEGKGKPITVFLYDELQ